ncbi:MAG: GNAT family N-acetyltransferase [Candidatus Pacebacteria bacterium]|nr:GNAT family N-acetyltransferase [Candidatus Paceibacterota bacterium]
MKLNRQSFTVTTERLVLVPLSLDYKDEIFKEFTDEITQLMYPSTPENIGQVVSFIEESIQGFVEEKEIVVGILHKENREYLGTAELHHINTTTPELGIWLKKSAHGNGYGKEAVAGLKSWADKHLIYEHLKYPVYIENIASRKIPEALGGVIKDEYEKANQKGEMRRVVEYHLYKEGR